ncbi:MAG: hypothetical protein KDA52_06970 [Planctomycetaceae bacterium]|nr:hypothetical protein [Planctomycetaceae bacterium]
MSQLPPTGFFELLTSRLRDSILTKSAKDNRNRRRRNRRVLSSYLEGLEDRTLLAAQVLTVGDLDFSGDFENGEGQSQVGTGQILVGYTPTGGEEFNPLLAINGRVTLYGAGTNSTTFSIEMDGEDAATIGIIPLASNPTVWKSEELTTLDAAMLVLESGQDLDADDSEGVALVASIPFFTTNISFVDPANDETSNAQVNLQGSFDFSDIGLSALKVGVTGDNDINVASDTKTVTLTGVDASLTTNFTVAAVEIMGTIGVSYTAADEKFTFSGMAKATVKGIEGSESDPTLGVTLAMAVSKGDIESIGLGLSGEFMIHSLEIEVDNLTFEYDTTSKQFVMYGSLSFKLENGRPVIRAALPASRLGLAT